MQLLWLMMKCLLPGRYWSRWWAVNPAVVVCNFNSVAGVCRVPQLQHTLNVEQFVGGCFNAHSLVVEIFEQKFFLYFPPFEEIDSSVRVKNYRLDTK